MRILNVISCYNDIDYLPYVVQYYNDQGVDLYLIDNYSTDGCFEWAKQHNIACHRIDTQGKDHDEVMHLAQLAVMHKYKPDWVIFGGGDRFIVTPSMSIKSVAQSCQEKGFNIIKCRRLEFCDTGEKREKVHPLKMFRHYIEAGGHSKYTICMHKYHSQNCYKGGLVQVDYPKICKIEGYELSFEATKPLEVREEKYLRKQQLIKKRVLGIEEAATLPQDKAKRIWNKSDLLDIRNLDFLRGFIDAA